MPLPDPKPGLVISYAYLWHDEAKRGREEGVKDRPCLIVGAQAKEEATTVMVMPITHTPPSRSDHAVPLSPATKTRLGLDDQASWIVTTEYNRFNWPGYDVRPLPGQGSDRSYVYGVIPRGDLNRVREQVRSHIQERSIQKVQRDEPQ